MPEKTILEQLIILDNQDFAFNIPETSTILWNISTFHYVERPWIPSEEFTIKEIGKKEYLQSFDEIMEDLQNKLATLQEIEKQKTTLSTTTAVKSGQISPPQIHSALIDHFNLEELRTLCFHLNINYDNLQGEGLTVVVH